MLNLNRANLSLETDQRRHQRRDRARGRELRPSCRVPISAPASSATNACARFNLTGGANPRCPPACANLRARALFRGRRAPAPDRRRLQVRAARGAGVHRCERLPARPRRRHHHRRPEPARRRLFQLSVSLGTQGLNAKNWRAIERDGLEKAFPQYAAQVALYQAYLDITNPALFTVVNADTCERLHFFVPFNAERAQEWSDRAVNIIEATRAGELLPRAYDDPQDWRCRMCSHSERCWR